MSVAGRFTRREFGQIAGAATLAHFGLARGAMAAPAPTAGWPGYSNAVVLDFLASPGPFNTPLSVPQLSPEMLRNAAESGITAVNLTIGGRDVDAVTADIAKWERDIAAHPGVLENVRSVSDIEAAKRSRKFGLIYGFQDTVAIGDDIARIARFHAMGLRIIQLTYNVRNLVGDGCLQKENGGLTPFGRNVVAELNTWKIIVDTGHTGEQSTVDAIGESKGPIAISHSACRAVADRPRGKRDRVIRAMADRGGVIGIYLMPFLTMQGQPTSDDVVKHIEHAVNVAGEDHVGIGSDLSTTPHGVDTAYMKVHRDFVEGRMKAGIAAPGEDPAVPMFVTDLNSPRRLELIAEKLAARKHSAARIEKIIGGNFLRLCRDVWGS